MSGRLVLAGQVIVDRMLRVPRLPQRGADTLADDTGTAAGGGYNVLAAAVRTGMAAVYAGAHGTGPNGDTVRTALTELGVLPLLAEQQRQDTGCCYVLTESDGERTLITVPGAEFQLDRERLLALLPSIHGEDTVYLSGYGLAHPTNGPALAAFTAALPEQTTVFLDAGPLVGDIPDRLLEQVLDHCDWLSCNRREIQILCGTTDPRLAISRFPEHLGLLLRIDADGCWLREPSHKPRPVPGFPTKVVDSNGAGDAHAGAFLAYLADGHAPFTAARAANAAGAIAVTRQGPATGPTRAEIEHLLGR